jgi:hypothetical protein
MNPQAQAPTVEQVVQSFNFIEKVRLEFTCNGATADTFRAALSVLTYVVNKHVEAEKHPTAPAPAFAQKPPEQI